MKPLISPANLCVLCALCVEAVCVAAACSHLLIDAIYCHGATQAVWGVRLLWPLAQTEYAFPRMPWGDVGTTARAHFPSRERSEPNPSPSRTTGEPSVRRRQTA